MYATPLQVQHKPTSRVMALKAMTKAQIVSSHQERNIMNEKNILAECAHPFVLEQARPCHMLSTFHAHETISHMRMLSLVNTQTRNTSTSAS